MYRLSTFAAALAICLGTTAVLNNSKSVTNPTRNVEANFAADGAFRDGLYLASSQPIADSRFVQGLAAGPRSKTAPCSPQGIAVDIAKWWRMRRHTQSASGRPSKAPWLHETRFAIEEF